MENNVKCRVCGKEDNCQQCVQQPGGDYEHICFECYGKAEGKIENAEKTHICVPPEELNKAYDRFISNVTEQAFNEMWTSEKKQLKELSKQEISKTSFFEGARFMLHFMRRASEESEKKQ